MSPSTRPRRTRTQSSVPIADASLRASLALGRRPFPRGRALESGQQWRGEDVEGERGGDRIAGCAEDRRADRARHRSEHDRMARSHGDPVDGQGPSMRRRPGLCSRRVRRSSPRSGSPGRPRRRPRGALLAIRSGSSQTISVTRASHPISRAWAASINELVSRISPGAGSAPIGRISSPVGTTTTSGRRRTISSVAPAAAQAATSTGRSRCPSGSRSSVALMSSPIERTCW